MARQADRLSFVGADLYELVEAGTNPVSVEQAKLYARISNDAEDDTVSLLVNAATDAAEKYSGRDFRANTWDLQIDRFAERICVRRSRVDTIESVTHIVSGSPVVVDSSVYYLKRVELGAEVLLQDDQGWPDDTDPREAAITIQFKTVADPKTIDLGTLAILKAVAYAYENRGDCDPSNAEAWLEQSGAASLLDPFRISRC